jgi:tetratricopeptide (TPR) repeat protein
MAADERTQGREPLSAAKRKRLEKVFEHASKKASTSNDFDYCTELLTQCVLGDPGNINYVRAYVENLQKKYGNNKKGSPFAQFQAFGTRGSLKKALAAEQWDDVIKHGLKILTFNPWDTGSLTGMASAAAKQNDRDCEMFYLKCAAASNPKDPIVCRLYAIALGERGMFDQAISWWHRVEEAVPEDDEARRAIGVLTVQKARSRGEFDDDDTARKIRSRQQQQEEATFEQRMLRKIEQEPRNLANYLELSQAYLNEERYDDAEQILAKAYEISDKDPDIREKWEDAQLRHLRQRIASTADPKLKKKLQHSYFERDMQFCKNRVDRYPNNLAFKYELGYRYKLTKRYTEAIQELQVAKNDPRRKGVCMLVLGECFQAIQQYRLAMTHYEAAIQEIPDRDAENKKKALYRAGRLAMGLKDIDAAERHLTTLAGLDFTYKDISALLDKISRLRDNPGSDRSDEDGKDEAEPKPEPEDEEENPTN